MQHFFLWKLHYPFQSMRFEVYIVWLDDNSQSNHIGHVIHSSITQTFRSLYLIYVSERVRVYVQCKINRWIHTEKAGESVGIESIISLIKSRHNNFVQLISRQSGGWSGKIDPKTKHKLLQWWWMGLLIFNFAKRLEIKKQTHTN